METERLRLRRVTPEDAEFLLNLVNSPLWLQHIGDRGIKSTEDAVKYAQSLEEAWAKNGFGSYCVELKGEVSKPVGMTGFYRRDTLPGPDIGFAYLPEHIGKGYGFEAASAVLASAREMRLGTLYAIVTPINERSIRLLEKLGLTREGIIRPANEDLFLYKIDL